MANERERQGEEAGKPQARPLEESAPERYPQVRQDDAIERSAPGEAVRSFHPAGEAPRPRETPEASLGASRQDGFSGPQGDPAEGKP